MKVLGKAQGLVGRVFSSASARACLDLRTKLDDVRRDAPDLRLKLDGVRRASRILPTFFAAFHGTSSNLKVKLAGVPPSAAILKNVFARCSARRARFRFIFGWSAGTVANLKAFSGGCGSFRPAQEHSLPLGHGFVPEKKSHKVADGVRSLHDSTRHAPRTAFWPGRSRAR